MSGRRLVMVGNGMAGLACLDAILQRDPSWQVTVFEIGRASCRERV